VLRSLLSLRYHSPFLSFLLLLSFCWPLLFFCRMRVLGRRPLGPRALKTGHSVADLFTWFSSQSHFGRIFLILRSLENYHFISSISAIHFSGIFRFYIHFDFHLRSILPSFLILFTCLFRLSFFHVSCVDFEAIFIPSTSQKTCFYHGKSIVFTKSPFREYYQILNQFSIHFSIILQSF